VGPAASGAVWQQLTYRCCDLTRPSQFECLSESNQRQNRMAGWPKAPVRLRSEPADGVASRRDCRAAVCARGDEPRATIPAAGYAALGRGPRNNGSLIIGSGADLAHSGRDRSAA
jgi:hypothetical protein